MRYLSNTWQEFDTSFVELFTTLMSWLDVVTFLPIIQDSNPNYVLQKHFPGHHSTAGREKKTRFHIWSTVLSDTELMTLILGAHLEAVLIV